MSFADDVEKAAKPVRRAILSHPFVTGIGDGTLEAERNQAGATIDWRFSTVDARVKLRHLYPAKQLG